MAEDYATKRYAQGVAALAQGKRGAALRHLSMAVVNTRDPVLLARIEEALQPLDPEARRGIDRDLARRRVELESMAGRYEQPVSQPGPDRTPTSPMGGSATSPQQVSGPARGAYAWVPICVWVFAAAAVLSVLGGILAGREASEVLSPAERAELRSAGISAEQIGLDTRDDGVLVAWIIAGFITAALWVGLAVMLSLLRDTAQGITLLANRRADEVDETLS